MLFSTKASGLPALPHIGIDSSLDLRDVADRFADTRARIEAIERRVLSRIGDDNPPDDDPGAPSAA